MRESFRGNTEVDSHLGALFGRTDLDIILRLLRPNCNESVFHDIGCSRSIRTVRYQLVEGAR